MMLILDRIGGQASEEPIRDRDKSNNFKLHLSPLSIFCLYSSKIYGAPSYCFDSFENRF